MATQGIEQVIFGLVDEQGFLLKGEQGINGVAEDTTGTFTVDAESAKGVASVALSGLSGSFADVYGSNELVHTSQGKAAPQSVITINSLPARIKHRLLGHEADGKGGYKIGGYNKTNVVYLAKSAEAFDFDAHVYVGLYKGKAQEASANMATNNQAEVRNQDAITIKHSERKGEGFGIQAYEDDAAFNYDALVAQVFKPRP